MATPTLKAVAPTTPEEDLTFAPEPVVIYGLPEGGGDAVSSVNGKTGDVVLEPADINIPGTNPASDLQEFLSALADSIADLSSDIGGLQDGLTALEARVEALETPAG